MNHSQRTSIPNFRLLAISLFTLLLSACVIEPVKLTDKEISGRISHDQNEIYKQQEPLRGEITFSIALARAIKYNLDYRLKLLEDAMSSGLLDVAELDLLPKLVTEAGYSRRSNDSGGTSIGIEDREVSLRPSTSEERSHRMARAEFSWNTLDFGLSYFRAKQAADEYNISGERRRKILQNILQDVRNAYWRAAAAQRLSTEADQLMVRIREALERSREAEKAGVLPAPQALAYQRALLDAMSMVNVKRQEMEFAKRELAALMNVTPGTDFRIAEVKEPAMAPVPTNVGELELVALASRPELREEDYRARIGQSEAYKQLAALFPSLNFTMGTQYNSNRYLYNKSWEESGLSLSVNLIRLAGLPTIDKTNEARIKADEGRRLALTMAVITQVRVSIERYRMAVQDYDLSAESARVDQRLAVLAAAAAESRLENALESLRVGSRALVSSYQQASSYANIQASYGRILNSLGLDLLPETVTGTDVLTLSKAIEQRLQEGERDAFLLSEIDSPRPSALLLAFAGIPQGMEANLRKAVEKAVLRSDIVLGDAAERLPTLLLTYEPPASGSNRSLWHLRMTGPDGAIAFDERYTSFLPSDANARTLSAFGEAAVLSIVPRVREKLLIYQKPKTQ